MGSVGPLARSSGGYTPSGQAWIEYRHLYNTNQIERRYWVLTENEIYWGISEPAEIPGQVWIDEPNDQSSVLRVLTFQKINSSYCDA